MEPLPPRPQHDRSLLGSRARSQLGLFFAGAAFMVASIAVSRRAVKRKTIAAFPKFHQANVRPPPLDPSAATSASIAASASTTAASGARTYAATKQAADTMLRAGSPEARAEGGLIAAEALGLATLNVFAFGVMLVGGASYAFDISSVEELRYYARAKMYGPDAKLDGDAEKEIEEWAAKVLTKIGAVKGQGEGEAGNGGEKGKES